MIRRYRRTGSFPDGRGAARALAAAGLGVLLILVVVLHPAAATGSNAPTGITELTPVNSAPDKNEAPFVPEVTTTLPGLGAAANFALLGMEFNPGDPMVRNPSIILNSATTVSGNIGYSKGVTNNTSQKITTFTGDVLVHSQVGSFDVGQINGNFVPGTDVFCGTGCPSYISSVAGVTVDSRVDPYLNQANADAMYAWNVYRALPTEENLGVLGDNDNRTVNSVTDDTDGDFGVTVVEIVSLSYNSDTLTLQGRAGYDDLFIIKITGNASGNTARDFDFSQSTIALQNVRPERVLWVFTNNNPNDIQVTMINKSASVFKGTILAPYGFIEYHNPATFEGAIIARYFDVHSDFNLTHEPFEMMDYGDAPDTGAGTGVGNYNTLLSDNGPRHVMLNHLKLGAATDAETDGQPNLTATGDDAAGTPDDEDGVATLPTITTASSSVGLTVAVLNNSGSIPGTTATTATLRCWIDFNRDGDFLDTGESASAVVSAGASAQNVNLTFNGFGTPVAGTTYLRCRIATVASEVAAPVGLANSGEVEDYAVIIQAPGTDLAIVKTASPDPVVLGQNLTYTLIVTNQGLTSATGVTVVDTLPSGVSFVSATPSQGTCGHAAGVVTCNLGTVPNGGSATITVVVTVTAMPPEPNDQGDARVGQLGTFVVSEPAPVVPESPDVWPDLPYGTGPGQWDTINELLRTAANYDFASGQKMTNVGTICGDVANASSVTGNGNYANTGTIYGTQWVGASGPIHSTYTSQAFDCQWYTTTSGLPPACIATAQNQPSDQLFVDIAIASNTAKHRAPTQTFASVDTNGGDVTINVVGGLNVINIPADPVNGSNGKLQVRGTGNLIIDGPADAVVIFNVGSDDEVNTVSGGMDVSNGRSILNTGGVQAQNILFNVLAGDVTMNGGVINGSILVRAGSDLKGKADIQGTTRINGSVLGDGNHSSEFSTDAGVLICKHADRGDAPDTASGTANGNYNTLTTDTGPFHVMVPTLKLGAVTDAETEGQPTASADGDDNTGTPDDEESVVAPASLTFAPGSSPAITVQATNTTGASASLRCWVDLNQDGDFLDTGEPSGVGVTTVPSGGTTNHNLAFGTLTATGSTYLRCRLSSVAAGVANPTGPATSSSADPIYLGEVEDHLVTIQASLAEDFGDAPTAAQSGFASSYPTTLAANGARHTATGPTLGTARDAESDGQPAVNADGDDNTGVPDDEDGVTIPTLTQTQTIALTVNASSSGKLDAWIDWNRDGDWADAGEQVATNLPVNAGNNTLNVNVPAGASVGTSYARFRLSTAGGLSVTGGAADGEVEDHKVTIQAAPSCPPGHLYNVVTVTGNEPETDYTNNEDSVCTEVTNPGSIGDLVWWDIDNDGIQDPGEPGIPGVTIELTDGVTLQTTTDANGNYLFTNLPADTYVVTILPAEFAPGGTLYNWTASPQDVGPDDTIDSDGDPVTHDDTVVLGPGEVNTRTDFGFTINTSITLEKVRNTPEPVRPGEPVSYTITIVNTGDTWIAVLPLTDLYDTTYLTYGYVGQYASPPSNDNTNDGQIDWSDLTPPDLAPGQSTSVTVWFTARADTTALPPDGRTVNTARVTGALADPDGSGPLGPVGPVPPQEDTARVQIIQPTGITLTDVRLEATQYGVRVSWSTVSEHNILGFNVLRHQWVGSGLRTYTVNSDGPLLATNSGTNSGAAYSLLDKVGDGIYRYDLEVLKLDGTSQRIHLGVVWRMP